MSNYAIPIRITVTAGPSLKIRVEENVSHITAHLEDQSLDLNARTMAILGKVAAAQKIITEIQ